MMENDLLQFKIKKRVLIIFFLISQGFPMFSQTIQIGSSDACKPYTNTSCTQIRIPISTNNNYTYSQQIIHKQKIWDNGWTNNMQYLTRIRYFINNSNYNGMVNSDQLCIYVGTTQKEKFDSIRDWIPISSMSVVLDTLIVHPLGESWWEIVFQTPFYYDGNENLVIAIHEKKYYYSLDQNYYLSTIDTCNSGIYTTASGPSTNTINPLNPNAGTLASQVPIVQLYFEETCSLPLQFRLSSLTHSSASFNWIPNGTETAWKLRYKDTNDTTWNEINNISTPSYFMSNLISLEKYTFQLQANCTSENSDWTNPIIFQTPIDSSYEYSVDWEIFKNNTVVDYSIMDSISPDIVIKLDSVSTTNYITTMDKFLSRVMGYIVPRKTGLYHFHFVCDDIGRFWLSSDEDPNNAIIAISIDSISTDWTLNQYSQYLLEGEKYFFKILHYDSVFNDMIKLGWIIPGDSIIKTIKKPYLTTSGNNISSQGLNFLNNKITGYQGYQQKIEYKTIPWNVSDKRVIWSSSDTSIAKVNPNGLVTLSGAGSCIIYGRMYDNNTIIDSLIVDVWTFKGPFYVKPNAPTDGSGLDWNNPIDLQTILNISRNRILNDTIIILVSEGIYKPTTTIDRNISFNLLNVQLFGGFSNLSQGTDTTLRDVASHETILSGDIGEASNTFDNSYHVVRVSKNVVLDGLTIRDGRASCSSYGSIPGLYYYKPDDNGGGIYFTPTSSKLLINNCKIKNNSAWNGGDGISCMTYSNNGNQNNELNLTNSKICDNRMEGLTINTGGMFEIVINTQGAGLYIYASKLYSENNLFYNNKASGHGKAIYIENYSTGKITNTTIYNNIGNFQDIMIQNGSNILINKSTIDGSLAVNSASAQIKNSTIKGNGYYNIPSFFNDRKLIIDNSIWTNPNIVTNDTSKCIIHNSIINSTMYGQNNFDTISSNLPHYSIWLDTLSYNGGTTPTMKLKNIPFNPAKSLGNPLYLDSLDQRGYLRRDSVSIGAYQWIRPDSISVSSSPLLLCQGDSIIPVISVFPDYADDPSYSIINLNDTIAFSENGNIYALAAGNAGIVFSTNEGNETDTMGLVVTGLIGFGSISGDSIVCQGDESVVYQVTPIDNATSYFWTLPSGAIGTSTSNSIVVNFSTTAISGYITVKGINNCGEGLVSTLAITVDPLPLAAGIISGDPIVCLGQNSVTYTVPPIENATSYFWTLPNGGTGTSTANTIDVDYGITSISGNISVKGTNNCGEGDVSILVISEDPLPLSAGTITGDLIVCQGENLVTYSVPPIENATSYFWTLPNGVSGTSSTNSIDVDYGITAISGNMTVKGSNQCGDGTVSILPIIVNPLPASAGIISGISTVCQGENSVTYSVPTIENANSYFWTLPSGASGASTTNTINVSFSNNATSGNISVKGINDCGVGTTSTKMITVNPLPIAGESIIGPASVCQGQNSVVYYVPTIANATSYLWTLPNGATGSSTTNTITVDYSTTATSGNITVKGINDCGEGFVSTLPVILNLIPASVGTISGNATVCQGQNSVTYTVPTIDNLFYYDWTLPNGATGSSLTNSIIVNYGTSAVSGNITVVGVNYCGNGPVSSKIITVNPLPSSPEPIVGFETVCQGQNGVNYSIPLIPNAISYVWSLPTGMTGTSSTNSINVNFGITSSSGNITVKGTNGCGMGTTASKAITVNSLPGIAGTISGANTVCVGATSVNYSVSEIINATSYTWTLPNGATGASTTNSINVNYGTTATSGNITVKGDNSCGNGAIGTKAITVNTIPNAAGIISGPTSVCQGETGVIYSIPSIVNANSYIWNYPNGATGASTSNSVTLNYGNYAVSGNITVKGLNLCGEGSGTILPVNVNPIPETPTILLNNNILSSDASTGNQWYNQNGIIEGETNQYFEITETGTYYVIVNQNDCQSNPSNSILVNNVQVENFDKNLILISPNPFTDQLTIKNLTTETYQYYMYNGIGQLVLQGTLETEVMLNTSDLAKGLYIIKFVNSLGHVYYKVIKQ